MSADGTAEVAPIHRRLERLVGAAAPVTRRVSLVAPAGARRAASPWCSKLHALAGAPCIDCHELRRSPWRSLGFGAGPAGPTPPAGAAHTCPLSLQSKSTELPQRFYIYQEGSRSLSLSLIQTRLLHQGAHPAAPLGPEPSPPRGDPSGPTPSPGHYSRSQPNYLSASIYIRRVLALSPPTPPSGHTNMLTHKVVRATSPAVSVSRAQALQLSPAPVSPCPSPAQLSPSSLSPLSWFDVGADSLTYAVRLSLEVLDAPKRVRLRQLQHPLQTLAQSIELLATSKSGTAIISPGPPRLGPDPKWDRRNALKVICRLVFEAAHQAH